MPSVKRKRSWGEFGKQVVGGTAGGALSFAAGGNPVSGASVGYDLAAPDLNVGSFKADTAPGIRKAFQKSKGKKVNKMNKKKAVKVSKSLRKKIAKVIEEKKISGGWTQISYGYVKRPLNNAQEVTAMNQEASLTDYSGGWAFNVEDFLHMASVLFNGKPDSQGNRFWNADTNLGNKNSIEGLTTQKFAFGNNARFTVKSSHQSYLLKNNTQSTMTLSAYICAPKQATFREQSGFSAQNTAVGGQVIGIYDPVRTWDEMLANPTGRNLLNADKYRFGMVPESTPEWNKYWSYEKKEIVLEPGQTTTFNVQGPVNHEMKYEQFFKNEIFLPIQKFSRFVFFIMKTDLIGGAGNDTDRNKIGRFGLPGEGRLCIERTYKVKIACPESAGVNLTLPLPSTGSGYAELNTRRPVYGYVVYAQNQTPQLVTRVDEVQPATQI